MLIRAKPSPERGGGTHHDTSPRRSRRDAYGIRIASHVIAHVVLRGYTSHTTLSTPRAALTVFCYALCRAGERAAAAHLARGGGSLGGARLTWPASASEHASPAIPTVLGL